MERCRSTYPFAAIVGQEEMKEALLLNVVYPMIGGVLIRGEKGTAKSTAVRSLAEILPRRMVVSGCPFRCAWGDPDRYCSYCQERMASGEQLVVEHVPMRVVELPLNATEDRVAGTLDIEHAIKTGKKRFEPGLLAAANGNILYVDEVNLLDDHIVDLLLDAAAMGINYVEREGVSFAHPSRFIMVGTMNPEEGELRPQLLDRFGLTVDVSGDMDIGKRKEIVERRISFERDPDRFREAFFSEEDRIRDDIISAQNIMGRSIPSDDVLEMAVQTCVHLGVDGHRADLTLVKAAMASAAMRGRDKVGKEDVQRVAGMVLPHRMRRTPFEESDLNQKELNAWMCARFPS